MATFTGTLTFYNSFILEALQDMNLSSDTFRVGLVTSGYTPDASNHSQLSDITNELSGNGYARQLVSNISLSESGGVVTWDFDDVEFLANGGPLTARRFFVYNDTSTNDLLVGFGLLDDNNLDVSATDRNSIIVQINASGFGTWTKT